MSEKEKNGKVKQGFSTFWQKTTDISKKAVDGVKTFADQTKKNIHDAQAKKYTAVSMDDFKSEEFRLPSIIEIVDDSANREFIAEEAIGWIEKHEDNDVLHIYSAFVNASELEFVPTPQCGNVYCLDQFRACRFINSNCVFGKATEEKLAELEHIAYSLGAKRCSVELVESDADINKRGISINSNVSDSNVSARGNASSQNKFMQSGKTVSVFEGGGVIKKPDLKWFLHDDNINRLIEMRCSTENAIKSKVLELKGASSATMSKKMACAIDNVMNIKGGISMESEAIKEHSTILIYEIEF